MPGSIETMVHPGNAVSIKVAEKLGFRPGGTARFMGSDCLRYEIRLS